MPPLDPPPSPRTGGKFRAYARPPAERPAALPEAPSGDPAAPADPVVAASGAARPVAGEGGAEVTAAVVQPLGPLATDSQASAPAPADMLPLGGVATPPADA